jgi:hypothetical protein
MNPSEIHELEQMALQAELARPLVHECNNFLNNLFLQMAIMEKAIPEAYRADWGSLRLHGKRLVSLLNEWQRYRKGSEPSPSRTELNSLLGELEEELSPEVGPGRLAIKKSSEPLWVAAMASDLKRLWSLLLRLACQSLAADSSGKRTVRVEAAREQGRIKVQIGEMGPVPALLSWSAFEGTQAAPSLPAAACKSLVERLGGSLLVEMRADRTVLIVELPAAA